MKILSYIVICLSLSAPALANDPVASRTTETRPWSVSLDLGFGAPSGLYGLTVGTYLTPEFELALGGGLGFTGVQLALLGRYALPVSTSQRASWIFGFGPSVALRGHPLGLDVEKATESTVIDPDHVFHTFWLNAEIGWMIRTDGGFLFTVSGGAALRLSDDQRHLCDDAPELGGGCNPMHFAPGSSYAKIPVLPWFSLRGGYAF